MEGSMSDDDGNDGNDDLSWEGDDWMQDVDPSDMYPLSTEPPAYPNKQVIICIHTNKKSQITGVVMTDAVSHDYYPSSIQPWHVVKTATSRFVHDADLAKCVRRQDEGNLFWQFMCHQHRYKKKRGIPDNQNIVEARDIDQVIDTFKPKRIDHPNAPGPKCMGRRVQCPEEMVPILRLLLLRMQGRPSNEPHLNFEA